MFKTIPEETPAETPAEATAETPVETAEATETTDAPSMELIEGSGDAEVQVIVGSEELIAELANEPETEIDETAREKCNYIFVNKTGEGVTEIVLENKFNGEKATSTFSEGPLPDGDQVGIGMTANPGETDREHFELILTFKTESGYEGKFEKLHFENVIIELIKVDAESGATSIVFKTIPEETPAETPTEAAAETPVETAEATETTDAPSMELIEGSGDAEVQVIVGSEELIAELANEPETEIDETAREKCNYIFVNKTGEGVTEIVLENKFNGEKATSTFSEGPLPDGDQVGIGMTANPGETDREHFELILTFKTESGYEGKFEKLHFENVIIELIKVDAESGATSIVFKTIPEETPAETPTEAAAETPVETAEATETTDAPSMELIEGSGDAEVQVIVGSEELIAELANEPETEIDETAREKCNYIFVNKTGEGVTEIVLENKFNGEKATSTFSEGPLPDGDQVGIGMTANPGETDREHFELILTFKTESGYEGKFEKLHFENVIIELIKVDAESGATSIVFKTIPEEEVKETVEEVKETVGEKVEEIKEAVGEKVEEVKEAVGEKVEEVKEAVGEVKEAVEEKAEGIVEQAQEAVGDAVEAVTGFVEGLLGTGEEAAETAEAAAEEPAPEEITRIYRIFNATGENVVEIRLDNNVTNEDAGNKIKAPLADGEMVELTRVAMSNEVDKEFIEQTLSFKTESGYEGAFKTLHFEKADTDIYLIKVDAESGATTVAWFPPVVEEVKESVEEIVEEVTEAVEEKVEGAAEAVEEKVEEAIEAVAAEEKTLTVPGFQEGEIAVTVTLDENGAIATLVVDAASQTPGLGQKCAEPEFTEQFIGKVAPFAFKSEENPEGIDAVTGATITSQAVVDALNQLLVPAE